MKNPKSLYHGHRFPASVISCAVRWYFRFQLSLRDIEELLFERGVIVSYETVRRWCDKFGAGFAHRVKAARRKPGTTWHLAAPLLKRNHIRYEHRRHIDDPAHRRGWRQYMHRLRRPQQNRPNGDIVARGRLQQIVRDVGRIDVR
jgi:transposase-like protein